MRHSSVASSSKVAKRDEGDGVKLIIRHREVATPAASVASEPDIDDILEHIYSGKQKIVSFKGSSQYGDKLGTRISASTCGLAALNFARIAFELEQEKGMQGLELLTELLSREMNEKITSICDYWKSDSHLEIEELLKVPIFKNTLALQGCTYSDTSKEHFRDLLQDMVDPLGTPADRSMVVVITRPPEIVACLKLRIAGRDIFVIFDSHPRPSHPDGLGFIINPSIESAAAYLGGLLSFDESILHDRSLQWEAQLLGYFSGHILLPLEEEPSTTEMLLESSMTLLSAYADVARERSRSTELQQKIEELEKQKRFMDERAQYLEQRRREDNERLREASRLKEQRAERDRNHSDRTAPSESYHKSYFSYLPRSTSRHSPDGDDEGEWQTVSRPRKNDKGKGPLDQVINFGLGVFGQGTQNSHRSGQPTPIDQRWEPLERTPVPGGLPSPTTTSGFDLDVAMAIELQQQFENEDRQLRVQKQTLERTAPATFRCRVCMDDHPVEWIARIERCQHPFCRNCLLQYTTSKLSERRFPITCPICATEKDKPEPGIVDDNVIQLIGVSDKDYQIFEELQIASFCVPVHCRRCEKTMFIDREGLQEAKHVTCPWPGCQYVWCQACQQPIENGGPEHSCDGSNELQHLMKQQGWKPCPGCQTPVQKSEGCNHMTCIAPACNSHFCYIEGAMIIKGGTQSEIEGAIRKHYAGCKLFDYT